MRLLRALPADERALGAVGADGGRFEFAQSGRSGTSERLPVVHGGDWSQDCGTAARDFVAPLNVRGLERSSADETERRKRRSENVVRH